jgi:tellurite resistance protein TerC
MDDLSVSPLAWIGLLACVLVVVLVDLLAVNRDAREVSVRQAAVASAVYLALGLGFGAVVWAYLDGEAAAAYYAGFLVEKSLSMDNVFVWAVIFRVLGTPPQYQRRVLFWGVLGTLTMRAVLIVAGAALLERFEWMVLVLATLLLVTGAQLARHRGRPRAIELERNPVMRLARRLPLTDRYHGARFLVREGGRRVATPVLLALVAVETTDLIFAIDSVPAILAITTNTWIVFAANAFALLGLRALYFLLAGLVRRFAYLDLGLAAVLGWVAAKMYYEGLTDEKVPVALSLAVIAAILGTALALSWLRGGLTLRPAGRSPT